LGLDPIERAYLKELSKHKSMRLNVIASKIGLPRQTIANVIEPYLIRGRSYPQNRLRKSHY
jgi:Holliday junction resolvasome RuvABC ATP-dependent DNA helicase subunit